MQPTLNSLLQIHRNYTRGYIKLTDYGAGYHNFGCRLGHSPCGHTGGALHDRTAAKVNQVDVEDCDNASLEQGFLGRRGQRMSHINRRRDVLRHGGILPHP